MKSLPILAILTFFGLLALTTADYCTETYDCPSTCYRRTSYTQQCGSRWRRRRCTRYRSEAYSCTKTCSRQVCCPNWTGSSCSIPLCYGSQSCPNGGKCDAPNTCSCNSGFALPQCADINECGAGTDGCEQICTNTHGSFKCSCRSGFILSSDLKSCIDLNECHNNNGGCEQTCENQPGTFQCGCNDGYLLNSDGTTCRDKDECTIDSSICDHTCSNTVGSFTCSCRIGYSLDLDGRTCTDVDECSLQQSTCAHNCHNTDGSHYCSCQDGYTLQSDQETCLDNDECAPNNGNCVHTCKNTPGSYACSCDIGYRLNHDKHACDDVDECTEQSSGCSDFCTNSEGSFTCSCPPGFYLDADLKTCKDIDECAGVQCYNGGQCVDGLLSYTCVCVYGYTGTHCESDVDECTLLNGGCQDICENTVGAFYCSCYDDKQLGPNGRTCRGSSPLDSVFRKYNIPGKYLPLGSSMIHLTDYKQLGNQVLNLSSTSEWYEIASAQNSKTRFTSGVVFAELNDLSIPLAMDGVEVYESLDTFQIHTGVTNQLFRQGTQLDTFKEVDRLSVDFTSSDKFEFIEEGSFVKTYFESLIGNIPDWLQLEYSIDDIISVQDLHTDVLLGSDIDTDTYCQGAPVFPDHLYNVFRFGAGFVVDIIGTKIRLPSILSGEKFCLIVDLIQSNGATTFFMIPREARDLLHKIPYFENKYNLMPRGIGLSILKGNGISVHHQKSQLALWNGDTFFKYPLPEQASVWVGADFAVNTSSKFGVNGSADLFLKAPSVNRILTAPFLDEWSGLVSVKATTTIYLKLKVFGKDFTLPLQDVISGQFDVFASFGGTSTRMLCGNTANPPGIFLSASLKINPFQGIPILGDWLFDVTQKVYAYFMSDPTQGLQNIQPTDILSEILDLQGVLSRFKNLLQALYDDIKDLISTEVEVLIEAVQSSIDDALGSLETHLPDIRTGELRTVVDTVNDIWKSIQVLNTDIQTFLDSAELFVDIITDRVTLFIKNEIDNVKGNFSIIAKRINKQVTYSLKDYDGYGLKYQGSVNLFGLKIGGLDIELVQSSKRLFACSRFDFVYKLFKDREAVRFLARVSYERSLIKSEDSIFDILDMTKEELIKFSQDKALGSFLVLDRGLGIGMALAVESKDLILQMQVYASMLGVKATADLFITEKQLMLYSEINVWNIFLAQLDVEAKHGRDWYDLVYIVRGRFLAKAKRKRQIQTRTERFDASYLDALIKCVDLITDEVEMRLSQAQAYLTMAQAGLSKAQDWLEQKKETVRDANKHFDNAVQSLEGFKDKLEAAKGPYLRAIDKLNGAQKSVDRLCKIRTCGKLCIPGIRCRMCSKKIGWGVRIRYPCCRFTSCMFKIPNPICIAANFLCRAVRFIAYAALEAAKILVRTVLIAYDIAKSAVSVAQIVVDRSRLVLDIAEGVLSFAQLGLEGAKGVLEVAKLSLEAVKLAIGVAARVFELVVNYGIKQLLDVRNCGFTVELSTRDLPVFDVFCDVNAFKSGWQTIKIRINFKNVLQSLWQAAKATIKAFMKVFAGLLSGRKRREVEFNSASKIHDFLRKTRSVNSTIDNSTFYSNTDYIDTLNFTTGFETGTDSDYNNRVDIFSEKCVTITNVLSFWNETFGSLFDIANETYSAIRESLQAQSDLHNYNTSNLLNNATLDDLGIDADYALSAYNITLAELETALQAGMIDIASDPLLSQITVSIDSASTAIDDELAAIESVQIINLWLVEMENITGEYFDKSECVGFSDCILHSISLMYDLYTYETHPEIDDIQTTISALEDNMLDVLQNSSSSIADTFATSESIMTHVQYLADTNLFCSTAPQFYTAMENRTVELGSTATIRCPASGDPAPSYRWYRDGSLLINQSHATVDVRNASFEDESIFRCVAENLVANITSSPAYLFVIPVRDAAPDSDETATIVAIVVASVAGCILLVGGATATWLYRRSSLRKPSIRKIRVSPMEHIPQESPKDGSIGIPYFTQPTGMPNVD